MLLCKVSTCKCKNKKGEIYMNNNYVSKLLESQAVCSLGDKRTIITDRMGPWHEQNVVLTWEGSSKNENLSLTPDEVEILFSNGLVQNVAREEDGKLYIIINWLDARCFNGSIVCGILAPSTKVILREEILDYAKRMGYVTDVMTPVKMYSGIKSLILKPDGTYNIFFCWNDNVLKEINQDLLHKYTEYFFSNCSVEIKKNGVLMVNLSEDIAFSRKNIDLFRVYDIQLFYLSQKFDKKLLLQAVMQRAFISSPYNILSREQFKETGRISIPEDRQTRLIFNKFGRHKFNCGIASYNDDADVYMYRITVPYTESIRELMIDTEKVLQSRYGKKISVRFSGFKQNICFYCNDRAFDADIERELICLDYAMTFLQKEVHSNPFQLYSSILSLLEADSSGQFRNEYFSYLETLKRELPDK